MSLLTFEQYVRAHEVSQNMHQYHNSVPRTEKFYCLSEAVAAKLNMQNITKASTKLNPLSK